MRGIHEVLVTASGNLLVKIAGKPNHFIYMTPDGIYLASNYEKNEGLPNNHIEWGALIKSSGKKATEATSEQIVLAMAAIEKRKEMLTINDMAGRMQWSAEHSQNFRVEKPAIPQEPEADENRLPIEVKKEQKNIGFLEKIRSLFTFERKLA